MATLSVVVIIGNNALTITKTIDSIVQQSRQADNVLLFDNGSNDGSLLFVRDLIAKYSYISVYTSDKQLDIEDAMSKAITLINGDYCFILPAIGQVVPGYFRDAMDMLAKNPDAGVVCADSSGGSTFNGLADESGLLWADTPLFLSPDQLSERMAGRSSLEHGVIFKHKALLDSGGFNRELKWYSAWFTSLVIAFRYGCIYFPYSAIADYSNTRTVRNEHAGTAAQMEIIRELIRLLKTERYSDVFHHFVKAGAMSEFPLDAVKVVMHTREFWDSASMLLITHPLHYWNNHLIQLRNDRQRIATERKVYAVVQECDALIDTGTTDVPEQKITTLIHQFPKFPDGYRLMVRLMLQKGNFTRALESCKTWISLQPQNIQAKIVEGFILFSLKEYDAAEKSFHDVLVIDGSNLDALVNLAELSMHFKRGADALGYLHRAQQYYPGNNEVAELIISYKKELGMPV